MSYAVSLCVEQLDRLLLVTKWLYPEVAAVQDKLESGGAEHPNRELHHLAGKPAPAGRTGALASGAETPKRTDAGDPGLLTGCRAAGGSWTG